MSAISQSRIKADAGVQSESSGVAGSLILAVCLVVIAMVITVHFDSRVQRWRANKGLAPLGIGVVSRIDLVETRGHHDTQVTTDSRTFYLEGVNTLHPGDVLEWRRSELHRDLCVVGTERCWDLMAENGD